MREKEPMTQTMKSTQARSEWGKVLNKVYKDKTQVVVEKSGIPVAAIISTDDLARYRRLDAQREADFSILSEMSAAFADQDDETIEREVSKALAEVRAENPIKGLRSSPSE